MNDTRCIERFGLRYDRETMTLLPPDCACANVARILANDEELPDHLSPTAAAMSCQGWLRDSWIEVPRFDLPDTFGVPAEDPEDPDNEVIGEMEASPALHPELFPWERVQPFCAPIAPATSIVAYGPDDTSLLVVQIPCDTEMLGTDRSVRAVIRQWVELPLEKDGYERFEWIIARCGVALADWAERSHGGATNEDSPSESLIESTRQRLAYLGLPATPGSARYIHRGRSPGRRPKTDGCVPTGGLLVTSFMIHTRVNETAFGLDWHTFPATVVTQISGDPNWSNKRLQAKAGQVAKRHFAWWMAPSRLDFPGEIDPNSLTPCGGGMTLDVRRVHNLGAIEHPPTALGARNDAIGQAVDLYVAAAKQDRTQVLREILKCYNTEYTAAISGTFTARDIREPTALAVALRTRDASVPESLHESISALARERVNGLPTVNDGSEACSQLRSELAEILELIARSKEPISPGLVLGPCDRYQLAQIEDEEVAATARRRLEIRATLSDYVNAVHPSADPHDKALAARTLRRRLQRRSETRAEGT